jgi:hypothetical protein
MKKYFQDVHEKAKALAQKFRQAESDLIEILQKVDQHKIFRHLGYSSLFVYALKELKLSEANASNFITVSRKAREVPQLKEEIKSGNITVSKARKITPVLNKNNSCHWLKMAKALPQKQLERSNRPIFN